MKEKLIKKLRTYLVIIILLFSFAFCIKETHAASFTYSDAVVENFASVVASEIGCPDSKDHFVYEMIWVGTYINQYNFWKESSKKQSTVVFNLDNMCSLFSMGKLYSPAYCYYTWAKRAANRGGDCTPKQKEQMNLAVKMVLSKSFNIPRNVYYAAEAKYANTENNVVWASFQPTINGKSVGMKMYYSTQNKQQPKAEDVYGNAITTDLNFYKELANCLYNNPTLYGAYNKCPGGTTPSSPPSTTKYYVLLYPNGGTGIQEGQKFEYTVTTNFTSFPKVEKTGCTLTGWNVSSTSGKLYTKNVEPSDSGQKLYANWNCTSSSSSNSTNKYTITFKLNDNTNTIFWSEVVTSGDKAKKPDSNPTRSGYIFDGWVTSSGSAFDFNTKITSNTEIYAKWTTTKKEPPKSTESSENPQTGITGIFIFVMLIIPSMLGIFYYHKQITEQNM